MSNKNNEEKKDVFFKPGQGSGDNGMTSLLGNRRVPKTHPIIKLNALLDEANAIAGMLKAETGQMPLPGLETDFRAELGAIQKIIMKISAKTAGLPENTDSEQKILEKKAKDLNKKIFPPKEFIIPGSNKAEALAHLLRTKIRLCEIAAWEADKSDTAVILNRLSDYVFLLALCLRNPNH